MEEQKLSFDVNKNYQWQPDDTFPLKGLDLHNLKQMLTAAIGTPEAQRAIANYESLKIVDNIIKSGVESGIIKEVTGELVDKP